MPAFWELKKYCDSPALVQDDGIALTYRQVSDRADTFAKRLGSGKKLVFILCANNIESCVGYLGCLRSKHLPLLLNAAIDETLLARLIKVYRPDYLWKPSAADGTYQLSVVSTAPRPEINRDLALLMTTSGSTGSPKMVRLSYRNLDSNAEAITEYLQLSPKERAITVLPINYSYGLSVINSHLRAGARILLTNEPVIQKTFWSFFKEQHATSLVGVPYTYSMYSRLGIMKMELPSLRIMTQAGGRLPDNEVRLFAEWALNCGINFYVMYGQTEATARISYLPPENAIDKSASVGIAIPGGRFSIIDMDGNEIKESGIKGELVYYGPNVSLGYAQVLEDLRKGDENKGVLKTGDIAQYDDERYIYITGRLKRFIKIAGNRVGLDEVETLLQASLIESVCGGHDNLLCIAIWRVSEKEEVKTILEDVMGLHCTMYRIIVVDSIPRNGSGKILYHLLFKDVLDD